MSGRSYSRNLALYDPDQKDQEGRYDSSQEGQVDDYGHYGDYQEDRVEHEDPEIEV